ncbi:hypothetical protein Droror1_Dr00006943 [Drosera rotundifolia]
MISRLCIVTIVFYTCLSFPFLQAKDSLLTILGFMLHVCRRSLGCREPPSAKDCSHSGLCGFDFQTGKYGDHKSSDGGDETCSVCLVEFGSEDLVSQLSRCGHVFHVDCIDRWLYRYQFTCPLCRTFLVLNIFDPCSNASSSPGS